MQILRRYLSLGREEKEKAGWPGEIGTWALNNDLPYFPLSLRRDQENRVQTLFTDTSCILTKPEVLKGLKNYSECSLKQLVSIVNIRI